jgi:ketosteroid isomerase-like protein
MARKAEPRSPRKPRAAAAKKPAGRAANAASRKVAAPAKKRPSRPKAAPRVRRTSPEEDALAVEAHNRRYYDAFQSLAVEEIAKLWWHDAGVSCIHPGWDIRHGIDGVLGSYQEILAGTTSIRFALGDVRVQVRGDFAYVTCVENLVTVEQDVGDYLGAVLTTNVFERRRGDWRLVHHHASPFVSDDAELPEGPLH